VYIKKDKNNNKVVRVSDAGDHDRHYSQSSLNAFRQIYFICNFKGKKVKAGIALNDTPSQSYGTSLV